MMQVNVMTLYNSTYNFTNHDVSSNNDSFHSDQFDMSPPLYVYVYVSAMYVIVFFVGLVGNALVIQVVARVRSMRKRMNYFLVSLSAADLLVILVGLPTGLHEFYGKEKWLIGEAMCKIVPFLENASHHCSVLTLLAIGFERYYAICHPLRTTVGSRVASATILIPAVWVVSCVVSAPFAIISNIKVARYYDDTLVEQCKTEMNSKFSRVYSIFISVGFLAVPLLLLTVLYSAIIRTLRSSTAETSDAKGSSNSACGKHSLHQNSSRNARAMASRRQVLRMMVGVMSLYFLCLVPLRCVQLWLVFGSKEDLVSLGFVGYLNLLNCVRILVFVNSAGNPIIYGLLSSNFRAAFRQSFCCCRSRQLDLGRQNTYYSNSHHHIPFRVQQKRSNQENSDEDSQACVKTILHRKENRNLEESSSYSIMAASRLRCRSTSDCSVSSVERVIVPLLGQAVSPGKDTEVITSGYQQIKHGLAYV